MQKTGQRTFLADEQGLGGKEFTTVQFPAMTSILLLRRVMSFVGPPLAALASGADLGSAKSRGDMLDAVSAKANVADAVRMLFQVLSESETEKLIRDMLASTTVDNGPVMPVFDLLFQGRIEEVPRLLEWVFEVNWGSFYSRAKSAAGTLLSPTAATKAPKPAISPAAS